MLLTQGLAGQIPGLWIFSSAEGGSRVYLGLSYPHQPAVFFHEGEVVHGL